MAFLVTDIIDSNTIQITPEWRWQDIYGNIIKIKELNSPAGYRDVIISKLTTLILNQNIELKNPLRSENQTLYCSVYLNDINIAQYFPELKKDGE